MAPVGLDSPRIVTRCSAVVSMAWYSALRTRRSLSGFLPLMLLPGSSSRNWSSARYTVRFSTISITLSWGLALMRARSWMLVSRTMSTSPESSAAMRVASDLMGV